MYMLLTLAADQRISPTSLPSGFVIDYVHAYATADTISTPVSRTIDGTNYADTLVGGTGDDTITGHAGNDVIDGGLGNNTAVFSGQRSD